MRCWFIIIFATNQYDSHKRHTYFNQILFFLLKIQTVHFLTLWLVYQRLRRKISTFYNKIFRKTPKKNSFRDFGVRVFLFWRYDIHIWSFRGSRDKMNLEYKRIVFLRHGMMYLFTYSIMVTFWNISYRASTYFLYLKGKYPPQYKYI